MPSTYVISTPLEKLFRRLRTVKKYNSGLYRQMLLAVKPIHIDKLAVRGLIKKEEVWDLIL